MKAKVIMKALLKGLELATTLWAIGVVVGAGLRDGAKMSDFHDQWYYDIIKARKLKGLQKKLQKLSKKEHLTEDEQQRIMELTHDVEDWVSFNTEEAATLGTKIVGSFDIHQKEVDKA